MPANKPLYRKTDALTADTAAGLVLEIIVDDRRFQAAVGRAEFVGLDGDRVIAAALVPVNTAGRIAIPPSWRKSWGACAFDPKLRGEGVWPDQYRVVGRIGF